MALMKYMVGHNAAHAKELADLAIQLEKAGSHTAYEQVMAAVSDFEKGNLRLSASKGSDRKQGRFTAKNKRMDKFRARIHRSLCDRVPYALLSRRRF